MEREKTVLYLLIAKHFLADGPLQTRFQYANKHRLFSAGLILHAGIHGAMTTAALSLFVPPPMALVFGAFDMAAHWAIDWLKASGTKRFSWASLGHDEGGRKCLRVYDNKYFIAIVADQCAHFATYALIADLAK